MMNAPMMGIDVSLWQRGINWMSAKSEGVSFAIIKASEGDFVDPCFDEHYANSVHFGLHIGAYHLLRATTMSGTKTEAEHFVRTLKGKTFDMPVYLDIELPEHARLPREYNTMMAREFCEIVSKAGYLCGVYTYSAFLRYNMEAEKLTDLPLWIGEIATDKPDIDGLGIWQYGGDRNLIRPNIVGGVVCDQNYCYIDYPAIIAGRKDEDMGDVDFSKFPGVDNEPAEWFRDDVAWAIKNEIMLGDENGLRLRDAVTREQMCAFLRRLYKLIGKERA